MEPTIKIYVETLKGQAVISSMMTFYLGPYTVTGPGKEVVREWIENQYGAFGHIIGNYAAPCDLHAAAMNLKAEPEALLRFVSVEGDIQEYDSFLAEGEMP